MSFPSFAALARRFIRTERSVAAVEFALVGLWAIGMIVTILNLALLSFSLGTLAHGVQAAAREAVVTAANSAYTNAANNVPGTFTCPTPAQIAGYFNQYANGGLPPAGTSAGTNPYLNAVWNKSIAAGGRGEYLQLTGTYKWAPLGFAALSSNIFTLKITTVATVTGTITTSSFTPTPGTGC